jgi:tryptophan synthase alpha chain
VGFGISNPEQVVTLRGLADGVIVGSAIVRTLERFADESVNAEEVIAEISDFAAEMVTACKA